MRNHPGRSPAALARALVVLSAAGFTACTMPPASSPAPAPSSEYTSLPDTVVCVVDRTTSEGLSDLAAKTGSNGPVVLVDGDIQPLNVVHPVNVIAGYAGREGWLTRGEPILFAERRYIRTGGERRVPREQLARAGEHAGILLFAGLEDPAPIDALYIPTAPGCVFQAYVREDLIRR